MRIVLLVLIALALGATADARFADTQGFSGKHGVGCVSCHFPEAVELGTAPTVSILGLPAAWDLATSYPLEVRVEGGPPGNPAPDTPQAGFDLEIDLGVLTAGADMDGLLRFPTDQEATYTGIGTFVRSWNVVWTSPDLAGFPRNATFWVGAIAANGNHVMDGPDVTGERGDRVASAILVVPPSDESIAAWDSQPLPPPSLDAFEPPVAGTMSFITGQVADVADGAEVRLDDLDWQGATGAPGFSMPLTPLEPGEHRIEARAVWRDRVSNSTFLTFHVSGASTNGAPAAGQDAPGPSLGLVLLFVALPSIVLVLRNRR